MNSISSIAAFSAILYQWAMVTSLSDVTSLTKLLQKEPQKSSDHTNTLFDFLLSDDNRHSPGEPKLRSKRRDITFYAPVATISQMDALRLLFKVYVNVIKATLRQGKPPLHPKFPKPILYMLKDSLHL